MIEAILELLVTLVWGVVNLTDACSGWLIFLCGLILGSLGALEFVRYLWVGAY